MTGHPDTSRPAPQQAADRWAAVNGAQQVRRAGLGLPDPAHLRPFAVDPAQPGSERTADAAYVPALWKDLAHKQAADIPTLEHRIRQLEAEIIRQRGQIAALTAEADWWSKPLPLAPATPPAASSKPPLPARALSAGHPTIGLRTTP
jgi:hypothetical protein